MEFTYFWAKCQYFQLNFYTLEQNVDVSSGFSLLLSKLSLFPMEFHYFSAKCQYFHRNFTTFEPHVNISLGFSLFLNLSPPITRGPYHGGGGLPSPGPWHTHIYIYIYIYNPRGGSQWATPGNDAKPAGTPGNYVGCPRAAQRDTQMMAALGGSRHVVCMCV